MAEGVVVVVPVGVAAWGAESRAARASAGGGEGAGGAELARTRADGVAIASMLMCVE